VKRIISQRLKDCHFTW